MMFDTDFFVGCQNVGVMPYVKDIYNHLHVAACSTWLYKKCRTMLECLAAALSDNLSQVTKYQLEQR